MAISIVKTVDVQTGVGLALRKIYITGVNATPGTSEDVPHGLGVVPDAVQVSDTTILATIYEEPTSYRELEAVRDATNLEVASVGTDASATATINVWYTGRTPTDDSEDAGEEVL
jgi:hypothetical protein